jgi:hypothetical protein
MVIMARKQCPPLDLRDARLAAQLISAENDDVELKRTKAALRRSPAVLLALLIDNDFELDDDEVFENQSAFIEMAMELSNHPGLSGLMLSVSPPAPPSPQLITLILPIV